MKEIYASKSSVLNIGFMGEDNRTRVHFPVGDLQAEFPGCAFVLLIKRAGDNGVYVVEPDISGDEALWTVEDGFLANKGEGEAVLICSTGTVTAKRKAWKTWTDYSLSGGVIPPADFSEWVTELLQAGADVQAAVDAYNDITAEAEEGEQTSAYIDRTGDHPVLKITVRGGGGAVESVNGKTGVVVLSASDVGALPDTTQIDEVAVQSTEPVSETNKMWIDPDGDSEVQLALYSDIHSPLSKILDVTLTEDAALIVTEIDGVPLAVEELHMDVFIPSGSITSGNVQVYNGSTKIGDGYHGSVSDITNRYWLARWTKQGGVWVSECNSSLNSNFFQSVQRYWVSDSQPWTSRSCLEYPTITKISMPVLPAGTSIRFFAR